MLRKHNIFFLIYSLFIPISGFPNGELKTYKIDDVELRILNKTVDICHACPPILELTIIFKNKISNIRPTIFAGSWGKIPDSLILLKKDADLYLMYSLSYIAQGFVDSSLFIYKINLIKNNIFLVKSLSNEELLKLFKVKSKCQENYLEIKSKKKFIQINFEFLQCKNKKLTRKLSKHITLEKLIYDK
jgi:hypothetical protein